MPLAPATKAHLQAHFCVLLWGFTAILGKLITLDALALVWWRMWMVVAALLLIPRVWRSFAAMPRRHVLAYAGIGVLVSLHWLTFYSAVKLANASVAATCIALAPVFLAIIEPWIARRPFEARELLIGIGVVPGVALVVGGIPHGMRLGLLVGVVSAVFVAIFSAWNKRMAEQGDALTVTGIELGTGAMFLTLVGLLPGVAGPWVVPSTHDTVLLLILALVCTLLPFALMLHVLRRLSAFAMQIITNLEPVYAIILAVILLDEQRELDAMFYLGVLIVLATVLLHPLLSKRRVGMPAVDTLGTAESKAITR